MNENENQQIGVSQTPSNPRYARDTSILKSYLKDFKRKASTSGYFGLPKQVKEIARTKRQAEDSYPYEIIYIAPQNTKSLPSSNSQVINSNIQVPNCNIQTPVPAKPAPVPAKPRPVYTAPKLEQIRAVYPIGTIHRPAKNTSCTPTSQLPANSIAKINPPPYVIPKSPQTPQSVCLHSVPPTRPTYKAIPVYLRPPYVYPKYTNALPSKPSICNCPIVTAPPPTTTTPCDTTTVAITTELIPPLTTPAPVQTTDAPLQTTQVPVQTTEAPLQTTEPNIPTTTETPVILSDCPSTTQPNVSCKCNDENGKKCAFCIEKAIIYIGDNFKPKSLATLKDGLTNLDNDDDDDDCKDDGDHDDGEEDSDNCDEIDDNDDNEQSSQKHLAKIGEIFIKNAIVKVNKPPADQSTLLQLIEKLRTEISKVIGNQTDSCTEDDDYTDDYTNTEPHDDYCDSEDGMIAEETAPGATAVASLDVETSDVFPDRKPATIREFPKWPQEVQMPQIGKEDTKYKSRDYYYKKREADATKKCESHANERIAEPRACECGKEHDLLEACKDLSKTISKYQSKS